MEDQTPDEIPSQSPTVPLSDSPPSPIVLIGGAYLNVQDFVAVVASDPVKARQIQDAGGGPVRSVVYLQGGIAIPTAALPRTVVEKVNAWHEGLAAWQMVRHEQMRAEMQAQARAHLAALSEAESGASPSPNASGGCFVVPGPVPGSLN